MEQNCETLLKIVRDWSDAEKAFYNCDDVFYPSSEYISEKSKLIIEKYFGLKANLYKACVDAGRILITDLVPEDIKGTTKEENKILEETDRVIFAAQTYMSARGLTMYCPDLVSIGRIDLASKIMGLQKCSEDVLKGLAGVEE